MRVLRERLSIRVCASFPFRFGGGMWDLIVLVHDHCLSIYFVDEYRCLTEVIDFRIYVIIGLRSLDPI